MSASNALPDQSDPLSAIDGSLNSAYHEQDHGVPDSQAHDVQLGGGLLGGGPEPDSVDAAGSPDLVAPVG